VALGGHALGGQRQHVAPIVQGDPGDPGVDARDQLFVAPRRACAQGGQRPGLWRAIGEGLVKAGAHDVIHARLARRVDIRGGQRRQIRTGFEMDRRAKSEEAAGGEELLEAVQHVKVAQRRRVQPARAALPCDSRGRPAVGVVGEERVAVHVHVAGIAGRRACGGERRRQCGEGGLAARWIGMIQLPHEQGGIQ
jgi:hypothetical protein